MDEFKVIEKYISPLTRGVEGAFGLKDDAAIINVGKTDLVIAKDIVTQTVHFPKNESAENIAAKALRVNLSDMASMGAIPRYYLVGAALSKAVDEKWIKEFTKQLAKEQKKFDITLLGGDTTKHDGNTSISITMIGEVPKGKAIKRSGAKVGDLIFVTGTIGDSSLGLDIISKKISLSNQKDTKYLKVKYRIPEPRISVGLELLDIATSAIDISDGLVADIGHICETSKVGATINLNEIPLSKQMNELFSKNRYLQRNILAGGDDYELAFTASPDSENKIVNIAKKTAVPITKIGEITKEKKIRIFDENNKEINLQRTGYKHL